MRWTREQAPPPLSPCGKRIRFSAEILLIESREGCGPLELSRGAERTDSPPHHPFSDSAEILWISGRGICKEAIFSPGGQAPAPKKSAPGGDQPKSSISLGRSQSDLPFPTRRSLASIGSREGSHLLELSGAVLMEKLISDEAGCSFEDFGSRRHERGALRSPTPPRVTGCERAVTLSRSPGAVLVEIFVPDDAGCSFVDAVSDDTSVGRSAPLLPTGVREGCDPLALSRSCSGGDFSSRRSRLFS